MDESSLFVLGVAAHERLDLGLDVLELGKFEVVVLHFLLLVALLFRLDGGFDFGRALLAVLQQHVVDCVALLLQLDFLLRVGIADDVLDGSGGPEWCQFYLLGMP